jgi:hypothetical protein
MIVMLKSKALGENQKSYNESLETILLKLVSTITQSFKKKHKTV